MSEPDEELRLLRGELLRARAREDELTGALRGTEAELERARAELADCWDQLRALRRSGTWRAGSFVRTAQRWLHR